MSMLLIAPWRLVASGWASTYMTYRVNGSTKRTCDISEWAAVGITSSTVQLCSKQHNTHPVLIMQLSNIIILLLSICVPSHWRSSEAIETSANLCSNHVICLYHFQRQTLKNYIYVTLIHQLDLVQCWLLTSLTECSLMTSWETLPGICLVKETKLRPWWP